MNYKNLAIWIGMPVILIIVWVLAVYMPITAQAKKKQHAIDSILKDRKDLEAQLVTMSLQGKAQDDLKKKYNEFLIETPTLNTMPVFMGGVLNEARTRGMGVKSLDGRYSTLDVAQKGIVNPVFAMDLKGGFLDMGKFLEDLSRRSAFKGIQKAKMAYDEKEGQVLSGKFLIEFKVLKDKTLESK
jgi:hypothetical protein